MSETKGKGNKKSKPIPLALHNELSEYNSLLRALRTSNTMDVTSQLSRYQHATDIYKDQYSHGLYEDDNNSDEGYDDEDDSAMLSGPSSSSPSPTHGKKRKEHISSPPPSPERKRQKREMAWTKWPLLLHDVAKPQWTLEDEISVMVSKLAGRGDEEDEEVEDYVRYLTMSASSFLDSLFAVVTSHTPARADSLQNRLNPVDWKYVLNVLAAEGHLDPVVIENTERRLEALYGSQSNLEVSRRFRATLKAKSRLRETFEEFGGMDADVLHIPEINPPEAEMLKRENRKPKRKYKPRPGRYKKRAPRSPGPVLDMDEEAVAALVPERVISRKKSKEIPPPRVSAFTPIPIARMQDGEPILPEIVKLQPCNEFTLSWKQ